MDNDFDYGAYIKSVIKRPLRSAKFLWARKRNNKPSPPITDRKAWADVHQRYEMAESVGHVHEGNEEDKQKYYSFLLNIPFVYDMGGKSILDIGGGPDSMLLRSINVAKARVVDPGDYPANILERYRAKGIEYVRCLAEDYHSTEIFDEVWIYNVLQHTVNTEAIIKNAMRSAGQKIRFLDWAYTSPTLGHPQTITKEYIVEMFQKEGWQWSSLHEDCLDEKNFHLVGWLLWGVFEKTK